ncbi:hypothetical protein GCM10010970_04280 [Silvimonas iriomotensis]|uniref:Uncharacterized protein n=1 Tax=Silvimonas iriomotensis TaxID=449662 RepID=A0ABQ2P4R0_9NEIS|nr:hypothetical protein GCM10010970_04280 [Silvimonas iriomotensis]
MLLAKSGWLRELASLKHPSAETPDFAAMLGAVKGAKVKSSHNCNRNRNRNRNPKSRKPAVRKNDRFTSPLRHSGEGRNPVAMLEVVEARHKHSQPHKPLFARMTSVPHPVVIPDLGGPLGRSPAAMLEVATARQKHPQPRKPAPAVSGVQTNADVCARLKTLVIVINLACVLIYQHIANENVYH